MGKRVTLLLVIVGLLLWGQTAVVLADTPYVVQPGDTLSKIAREFGTTVAAIAEANNIVNPNLIVVGQTLIIPVDVSGDTPSAAPPAAPPPAAPGEDVTYIVQPGDNLYRIAAQHGVTVQAIAAANDIEIIGIITVGQVLTIPGAVTTTPPPASDPDPASPAPAPPPPQNANRLLNGSFEESWYHPNGIPELQLPQHWIFEWDQGPTGFGGAPWDVWVRPEVRVLPSAFLPPHEHLLFIYHGDKTVKVFKGSGAISFRLVQDVTLEAGTYQFTVSMFPDLYTDFVNGQKIWPSDPHLGEVRFIVGGGGSGWLAAPAGQKRTFTHTFTINSTQAIRVGVGVRGKYAIQNNGWFLDDWTLVKVQ